MDMIEKIAQVHYNILKTLPSKDIKENAIVVYNTLPIVSNPYDYAQLIFLLCSIKKVLEERNE